MPLALGLCMQTVQTSLRERCCVENALTARAEVILGSQLVPFSHPNETQTDAFMALPQRKTEFFSPAEVDSFLRHLSRAVLGVSIGLVPHHLHPFSAPALLAAVLADHVQLPDPVLEPERDTGISISGNVFPHIEETQTIFQRANTRG